SAQEIVQKSVENTNADWSAAPRYDYTEHDVAVRGGKTTARTYQVTMIDGSPYNKLISENGAPLPPQQAAEEDRKLAREISSRNSEAPTARDKRVAGYLRERRQDNALMSEMGKAFDFSLAGEDTVSGRRCYVLDATPKPGYQPPSRETGVLKGM